MCQDRGASAAEDGGVGVIPNNAVAAVWVQRRQVAAKGRLTDQWRKGCEERLCFRWREDLVGTEGG